MEILAVPQSQGAVVARSALLPAGCGALARLAGEVLGAPVRSVPLPEEGSPAVDGIANRDALLANRKAQLAAIEVHSGPLLTVGGDCATELVPLGVARWRHREGLCALWYDAHADLNTPQSSPSGAFHGMVLRAAFGEGDPQFAAAPALERGRAVLAGARSLDDGELAEVRAGLATHLPVATARDGAAVADAVLATGAGSVYLHIDLDVLDPKEFAGACYPEPDGLLVAEVVAGIRAVADALLVVGVGITECATDDPDELRTLVPIIEAVGSALGVV
ncbi:arginase family protein [Solihabitans fulvus]|uniref:Arginase family protein n=1 Tax=Solihabitans fulvus TaxID=1892852 RepID=A0A5B2WP96_9PSEU|nr:arginase family protein [Solihabitans fulvus]KAA2253581.1 arginase family protein [Solihabitans fulvus]